jgi:hypothetical protein
MNAHLVACEVFQPELAPLLAQQPGLAATWLRRRLHDRGPRMVGAVQEAIDALPADIDTVLLAYGRCGNGLVGLHSAARTLVCYRAHDCIPVLVGDRARHTAAVAAEAGTCWLSPGWMTGLERGRLPTAAGTAFDPTDPAWSRLVERRGEERAREAWEAWVAASDHYRRVAWIDSINDPEARCAAAETAAANGLDFVRIAGDMGWARALLGGSWDDERFVVVPPGHRLAADDRGGVLVAVAA